MLIRLGQYNADRCHLMKHIAQPDFILFFFINSANGIKKTKQKQECSRASVRFNKKKKTVNKIMTKKGNQSNFVQEIK